MPGTPLNVVFDCVGTLVDYSTFTAALDVRLGAALRAAGVPNTNLLVMCWVETAEREYTYLSLSNRYTPFYALFGGLFTRVLHYAGVPDPKSFCTEEDIQFLMDAWKSLTLRPGAKECVQKLRDAGFTVWGFTAGDLKRVGGYFEKAGVKMPKENLLSCDTTGVAKPIPKAYVPVLERLKEESGGRTPWFAAAHLWDVSAARGVGFKGAYSTVLEAEALTDIFGEMDVIADSLPAMADAIIAAEKAADA